MGDRANVMVINDDESVYLYTHWMGTGLPDVLRSALRRGKDRWTDASYLTRIIFCEMVKGQEMETTGFGISQRLCDGDDRILKVDARNQTVQINKGPKLKFAQFIAGTWRWDT